MARSVPAEKQERREKSHIPLMLMISRMVGSRRSTSKSKLRGYVRGKMQKSKGGVFRRFEAVDGFLRILALFSLIFYGPLILKFVVRRGSSVVL